MVYTHSYVFDSHICNAIKFDGFVVKNLIIFHLETRYNFWRFSTHKFN